MFETTNTPSVLAKKLITDLHDVALTYITSLDILIFTFEYELNFFGKIDEFDTFLIFSKLRVFINFYQRRLRITVYRTRLCGHSDGSTVRAGIYTVSR